VSTLIGRVQQLEIAPPKMDENKEDDAEMKMMLSMVPMV
jgi:hypothetical protein